MGDNRDNSYDSRSLGHGRAEPDQGAGADRLVVARRLEAPGTSSPGSRPSAGAASSPSSTRLAPLDSCEPRPSTSAAAIVGADSQPGSASRPAWRLSRSEEVRQRAATTIRTATMTPTQAVDLELVGVRSSERCARAISSRRALASAKRCSRSFCTILRMIASTTAGDRDLRSSRLRRRRRLVFHVEVDDVDRRLRALERQLPGQHLVRHHAERVEVRAPVELLAAQLLRRHELQRPQGLADRGQRGHLAVVGHHLGDAEVEHLDVVLAAA